MCYVLHGCMLMVWWIIVAVYQLSTRALDDAMSSFQAVLKMKPTNVIALLGKVSRTHSRATLGMNFD